MTSLTEGYRYKYLFCDTNNGYFCTYKPFTINKRLNKELVDKYILEVCPAATRIGGTFDHLRLACDRHDLDLKQYHSIYVKYEQLEGNYSISVGEIKNNYDQLPSEFYHWEILNTVTGNY